MTPTTPTKENQSISFPHEVPADQAGQPGLFVGLDIGGTKTAVLVVDQALNVLGRGAAPTIIDSPQQLVDGIYAAVVDTLDRCAATTADLLAVGAGVPGMVDPQSGMVQLAVNLNLQKYPLGPALEACFGVPVALENDVRAASLGAYRWLNDREPVHHMAYLSIGTGISSGLVVEGRLYRGAQGMAGEIGHVIFETQGPLCRCGLHGCLEAISAGPSIARHYAAGDGTAESVFKAAEKGDSAAREGIDHAASGIARAVQLLVMSYDVEKVVLGGGVLNAGSAILDPVYEHLAGMREKSSLAMRMLPAEKVVAAPAEADVARWGAVLLALEAFKDPAARSQSGTQIQIEVKKNP